MALTGLAAWQAAINNTAVTNGVYSGSLNVASSANALVLFIVGWSANSTNADPANWTVTLNGADIQPGRVNTSFAGSVSLSFAAFVIDSPPAGTGLPLAVNFNTGSSRACLAYAAEIGGQAAAAFVQTGIIESFGADVTTLDHTHASTSDGNAIITAVGLRGGVIGTVVSTGTNSVDLAAQSGTNAGSDMGLAAGAEIINPAATVTHGFSGWSARRAALIWVEIAAAAGGPAPITGNATGVLVIGGTATGSAGVGSSAAGTLALSGAAAGVVAVAGTGAGAIALGGSAAAAVRVVATAAGSLSLAGSATAGTGAAPAIGDAAGTLALAGMATAGARVAGNASGALALGGMATASVIVKADAAGALVLAGGATAAAGAQPVTGNAAGVLAIGGTATVTVLVRGSAAGVLVVGGTAGAVVRIAAGGAGVLALSGAAAAGVAIRASAAGVLSIIGGGTGAIGILSQRRWAFPAESANGGTLAASRRGGIMSRG